MWHASIKENSLSKSQYWDKHAVTIRTQVFKTLLKHSQTTKEETNVCGAVCFVLLRVDIKEAQHHHIIGWILITWPVCFICVTAKKKFRHSEESLSLYLSRCLSSAKRIIIKDNNNSSWHLLVAMATEVSCWRWRVSGRLRLAVCTLI